MAPKVSSNRNVAVSSKGRAPQAVATNNITINMAKKGGGAGGGGGGAGGGGGSGGGGGAGGSAVVNTFPGANWGGTRDNPFPYIPDTTHIPSPYNNGIVPPVGLEPSSGPGNTPPPPPPPEGGPSQMEGVRTEPPRGAWIPKQEPVHVNAEPNWYDVVPYDMEEDAPVAVKREGQAPPPSIPGPSQGILSMHTHHEPVVSLSESHGESPAPVAVKREGQPAPPPSIPGPSQGILSMHTHHEPVVSLSESHGESPAPVAVKREGQAPPPSIPGPSEGILSMHTHHEPVVSLSHSASQSASHSASPASSHVQVSTVHSQARSAFNDHVRRLSDMMGGNDYEVENLMHAFPPQGGGLEPTSSRHESSLQYGSAVRGTTYDLPESSLRYGSAVHGTTYNLPSERSISRQSSSAGSVMNSRRNSDAGKQLVPAGPEHRRTSERGLAVWTHPNEIPNNQLMVYRGEDPLVGTSRPLEFISGGARPSTRVKSRAVARRR